MALRFVMYGKLKNASDAGMGHALHEVFLATSGQTDFVLAGSYRMGVHELEVYLNGVRQTIEKDYTEVDTKSIRFTAPLELGESVMFAVTEVRNTTLHLEFVATDAQDTFVLTQPYHPNMNSLQVFADGRLLRLNDDYEEVNESTVRFLTPLAAGVKVTFKEVM